MRLLVVDDDTTFREELQSLLQDEGHDVQVAPSVQKALAALEEREYDLVFSDLRMPRQSGLVLLREAKARWPRIYFVMITGFATVETAVEAMKLGAFDYIRKPFQLSQVQRTIELVKQEIAFSGGGIEVRDPARLAAAWATERNRTVLLMCAHPPRPHPRVTFHALDPANPALMVDAVAAFVPQANEPAVVLAGVEGFFESHRVEEVVDALTQVRSLIESHGPLAIGFDPSRISDAAAVALRAAVTAPESGATLEALTSPIRRLVLRRLAQGPGTFTDAMHAAKLDDSPKLSFHMRRLVEEGLIGHSEETYRLTAKGEAAIRLLDEIDSLNVGSQGAHVVFALPAVKGPRT